LLEHSLRLIEYDLGALLGIYFERLKAGHLRDRSLQKDCMGIFRLGAGLPFCGIKDRSIFSAENVGLALPPLHFDDDTIALVLTAAEEVDAEGNVVGRAALGYAPNVIELGLYGPLPEAVRDAGRHLRRTDTRNVAGGAL